MLRSVNAIQRLRICSHAVQGHVQSKQSRKCDCMQNLTWAAHAYTYVLHESCHNLDSVACTSDSHWLFVRSNMIYHFQQLEMSQAEQNRTSWSRSRFVKLLGLQVLIAAYHMKHYSKETLP